MGNNKTIGINNDSRTDKHIFLTGEKQIGKSTIITKLIEALVNKDLRVNGIRSISEFEDDVRKVYLVPINAGIEDYNSKVLVGECVNHHITMKNTDVFDNEGTSIINSARNNADIIIIDEIGKMEKDASCYANQIISLLEQDDIKVIGVIQNMACGTLADYIRDNNKIEMIEVNIDNRDEIVGRILG